MIAALLMDVSDARTEDDLEVNKPDY